MFFILFDARDMNTQGWMVEIATVFKRCSALWSQYNPKRSLPT